MLLRWLILQLCATRAEIRLVLRAVRIHYAELCESQRERASLHGQTDKRITRSARLSMLCGLLMLYVESPRLFVSALVALPLAVLLVLLRGVGVLH